MESWNQPWTVVNKYEQYQTEPKTYEYYSTGTEGLHKKTYGKPEGVARWEKLEGASRWEKPEYYGKYEKPEYYGKYEKPEYYGKYEKPEYYGKYEKPEYYNGKYEKPEGVSRWEKSEYYGKYEKPEGVARWEKIEGASRWEKPEYYGKYEKPEYYGKYEKPEYYGKYEKPEYYNGKWEKNEGQWKNIENVCGEWEKVCDSFERCQLEGAKPRWSCRGNKCCDVEMVTLIKEMINILIGAEQSYIQLGFLCMDEKFTLVNTSEYFRLCGLRMRWLANGLIGKSVRLFNVNEWINSTTFENFFKVPSKEELATNDYTSIIKTFFKIAMEAENRLVERMTVLGEKMIKTDAVNTECRFEGAKWFVNFVLPYQTHFVREMTGHWRNIEMCNNGFIFDKCEMYPLVQKIEEFINQITKINTTGLGLPIWEKNGIIPTKKW